MRGERTIYDKRWERKKVRYKESNKLRKKEGKERVKEKRKVRKKEGKERIKEKRRERKEEIKKRETQDFQRAYIICIHQQHHYVYIYPIVMNIWEKKIFLQKK